MSTEIYLDNSATTRQYDEVTSLMAEVAFRNYGNPSSLHTKGDRGRKARDRRPGDHSGNTRGPAGRDIFSLPAAPSRTTSRYSDTLTQTRGRGNTS